MDSLALQLVKKDRDDLLIGLKDIKEYVAQLEKEIEVRSAQLQQQNGALTYVNNLIERIEADEKAKVEAVRQQMEELKNSLSTLPAPDDSVGDLSALPDVTEYTPLQTEAA